MPIETLYAAAPTVINATFDKIWVEEIVISALTLGGEVTARVRLRKFRTTEDGAEFSPDPAETLTVEELLAGAEADNDLAAAVGSIMNYVAKIGREQGVVAEGV